MPRVLVVDDQADVSARDDLPIVLRGQTISKIVEGRQCCGPALQAFEDSSFRSRHRRYLSCGATQTGFDLIRVHARNACRILPVCPRYIGNDRASDFLPEPPELSNVVCLQKAVSPRFELMRATEGGAQIPAGPSGPIVRTEVADGAVP